MTPRPTIRWLAGTPDACAAINRLRAGGGSPEILHTGPYRKIEAWAPEASATPTLVLKWFTPRGSALRQGRDRLLARTTDAREWRALHALAAAGLPVPRPLAHGRLPSGERVVAMAHAGEASLRTRLRTAAPDERRALLAALVDTVRRLHAAGFVHGDLHLGNLRATGESIQLLDLGRSRRSRSPRAREQDLARLLHSLDRDADDADDAETLRAALGGGPSLDDALRAFLADHARGRARRFLRVGARWQRLEPARGWSGLGTSRFGAGPLEDALLRAEAVRVEAPRRSGRVAIEHVPGDGAPWIRKHAFAGSLRRAVADRGRGSPARRAFLRGERDRLISDRAAPALAYLERRVAGRTPESLLLLERVGDVDLDAHHPNDAEEERRLAFALVDWLADQHARGLGHRDAKGGNIRVGWADGGAPRFWWVDLEDLVGPVRVSEAARLHALVQLNASLADDAFDSVTRREALARYHARIPFTRPLERIAQEIHTRSLTRNHRYRGGKAPISLCSP